MAPTSWTPELSLDSRAGRCRLTLAGVTYGNGESLQQASNDLLVRLHDLAVGMRHGAYRPSSEAGGDPRVAGFLWEIGELTARGADIRARVFGDPRA
ncbi:hypothetical protein [Catellatospora tritici]|uniref:hypothetical protein n=1 Tax=Catellatospora tritici TaxID=2851566 RepID=UPI001C2DA6CA|nr:hypothetical protein [Catellatospora tritici]MBV1850556.1 hypothetical protein [Catellatospora tritici]